MDAIIERRSIRKYETDPISKEDIEKIIRAAILAPSAKNRQPWKYIVYQDESKNAVLDAMEKGLLRERDAEKILPDSSDGLPDAFYTLKIMRQAPVLILVENRDGQNPYEEINTDARIGEICDTLSIGASIENLLLAATELGLGTLWIANTCFAYPEVCEFAKIEGQLIGAVSVGIPAEAPNARPRRKLEDVVEFR